MNTEIEMELERLFFPVAVDEAYRPLPYLYLAFLAIWFVSAFSWTINTWKKRHFQPNNLQWALALVPLIKALQLGLSFLFWYSCFSLQICSLWMSFGVYVTGVLFQTASFVSFLLIAHGYCIMCERLSVPERRTTAALGCALYLTLVGYKASVPYFTVLLLLNYFISFYVIFHNISQNLLVLREQLSLIREEDIHSMHDAVYTKYTMFRKFQGAMQIAAAAEIMLYMDVDDLADNFWLRLLIRELAQFCIFLYIGWTFRSRQGTQRFFVIPTLKVKGERIVPPIYSIVEYPCCVQDPVTDEQLRRLSLQSFEYQVMFLQEMDAADFKDLSSQRWHVGVPTFSHVDSSTDSLLIIVQHPHSSSRSVLGSPTASTSSHISTADSCSNIVTS